MGNRWMETPEEKAEREAKAQADQAPDNQDWGHENCGEKHCTICGNR